jgi:ABC-type multidrug transport system fused ATPase/permease subunit
MRALARARGSAARIAALLGLKPAASGRGRAQVTDRVPHIVLRQVTATWTGERTDLRPVDLDLPAGSRVALTGPNGSGKSTLLAVMARHLDPASGGYTWDGVDVLDVPLDDIRGRIALVDDEPHVFATTLRHNLLVAAPSATETDVEQALSRAGLAPLVAELPDGLDTVVGAGGRGLSGGERARLGIARALVSRRPVVLLDEPVAHLDSPTALAVLSDLMQAEEGDESRTILMVTHRPEGISLFDRVVTLEAPHE